MIESLKQVITGRRRGRVFAECRRCGTSVDLPVTGCPGCGSTEIARYEL